MVRHVERPAGSPGAGGPAFLAVGKVRRPHGVTGEVVVEIYTDFPERLKPKTVLYAGDKLQPLIICRRRNYPDGLLLAFEGFNTPEEVGLFRNQTLFIPSDEASVLPDGEYYYHELLGLAVVDEAGEPLGEVTEIMQTGANDVYLVTDSLGREILLPATREVILEIDLSTKLMKVHLLPGLLDKEKHSK